MLGGGRKDVEDAAAHRELTAAADHIDPGVGELGQSGDEVVEVQFGADPQRDRFDLGQIGGHRLQQRTDRRHHHAERGAQMRVVGAGQAAQQHQPRADGIHPR